MMNLRHHQKLLKKTLDDLDENDAPFDILAHVIPGGGKSMLPGLLCRRFPNHRLAWFVPRLSLARQAAVGMMHDFGIEIRESGNDTNPSRGTRGFVTTHAALTTDPDNWFYELERHRYLLVIDELHHAKLSRTGEPNALASALARLQYHVRLSMTGTLETNDNSLIYCVPYSGVSGGYKPDLPSFKGKVISYSRSEALRERAILPVEFHRHDGPVKWEDKNGIQESNLSDVDSIDEAQAVWTALRTDLADQLLKNCIDHWRQFGDKLLVVTADQQTAKKYHASLKRNGIPCGLAISDADDAHEDIENFREGGLRCLITCQMAYEGLDVPSITHIACLTHIRSTPWILQMLARGWRATSGKDKCYAFVPNDPRMDRVIERIRSEQDAVVPLLREGHDGYGPSGQTAFVPISGEVSSVTLGMLDGEKVEDPASTQVAALCREYNLPIDHPDAAKFASTLRAASALRTDAAIKLRKLTRKDKEKSCRAAIVKTCNRADHRKGTYPGTHQKRLWNETGKSIKKMTLQELENARSICDRICS